MLHVAKRNIAVWILASPVSLVPFDFGNNRYRQISGGAIIFFVTTSYYPTLQALLFAVTAYWSWDSIIFG